MNRNVKEVRQGREPCKDLRKNFQEREKSKYKEPEVKINSVASIKARVRTKQRRSENHDRKLGKGQSTQGFISHGSGFDFYCEWDEKPSISL